MENIESVERFVEYGLRKDVNMRFLRKMTWGLNIWWILGFFIGYLLGGIAFVYGTVILCLGLLSPVFIEIKRKDESVYGVARGWCILSITSIVNHILLAEILCGMLTSSIALKLVIAALPLGMIFLLYFVTKRRIKTNAFKDSQRVAKSNRRLFCPVWGAIGISFGRLFMTKLQQESAIAIVIICFLVFSLLYCFGTINLLKVYYINKYNLEKYKHVEEADK